MQRGKRLIKTTFCLHTLNASQKGELVIKVRKENHYQPKQDRLTPWLPMLYVKNFPEGFFYSAAGSIGDCSTHQHFSQLFSLFLTWEQKQTL